MNRNVLATLSILAVLAAWWSILLFAGWCGRVYETWLLAHGSY